MKKHNQLNHTHLTQSCGYSLIELLTIVTVVSVLASYAYPAIQGALRSYEANSFQSELRTLIADSRSQAGVSFSDVVMCGTSDGQICQDDWTTGILVFLDINADRKYKSDTDIKHQHIKLATKYGRIDVRGSGGGSKLFFKQFSGQSLGYFGSVYYCGQSPKYHRGIVVSGAAMMRYTTDTNKDGIQEDSAGKPLTLICGE